MGFNNKYVVIEMNEKSNTLTKKLVNDTKKKNKEAISKALKFIQDNKNVGNA